MKKGAAPLIESWLLVFIAIVIVLAIAGFLWVMWPKIMGIVGVK